MVQSERFEMRVSSELLESIDEWRRHEPDIPPRAEAIRRLIEAGLKALGAKHKGAKK
jgi:metal-responsive CopG/Arc/MetJ family transcriptional regulator